MSLFDGPFNGSAYARPTEHLEPALKVIREHRDIAKGEIARLELEIDVRHAEMNRLRTEQEQDVKQLRDFQVELRAHERLLAEVRGPFIR